MSLSAVVSESASPQFWGVFWTSTVYPYKAEVHSSHRLCSSKLGFSWLIFFFLMHVRFFWVKPPSLLSFEHLICFVLVFFFFLNLPQTECSRGAFILSAYKKEAYFNISLCSSHWKRSLMLSASAMLSDVAVVHWVCCSHWEPGYFGGYIWKNSLGVRSTAPLKCSVKTCKVLGNNKCVD